jgi:hypothetical protein
MRPIFAYAVALMLGGGALPAHAQPLIEPGRWLEIPNTEMRPVLPTREEVGSERGTSTGAVNPWIGFAYNAEEYLWLDIRPGGHRDAGTQDSYAFDWRTLSWARVEPLQDLTEPNPFAPDSQSPWPPHGPPSCHTYDGVEHVAGAKYVYFCFEPFSRAENSPVHSLAYEVATSTKPWKWTHLPHLDSYAALTSAAVHGGLIYVVNKKGEWAVIDAASYEILKKGTTGTPGAGLGAADIVGDKFCYTTPTYIKCSPLGVEGFGKFTAFRHGLVLYAAGLTGSPDGRAVIWDGEADVWAYDPDTETLEHFVGTGDVPTTTDPATGLIYSKWRYIPHLGVFAAYNDLNRGVRLFALPDMGGVEPGPEPDPEPDDPPVPDPEPATDRLDCTVSPLTYPEGALPPVINLNVQCKVTTSEAEPAPDDPPVEDEEPPVVEPDPSAGFPIGPGYGFNVATADFAQRCAADGAFFCQGFDDDIPAGSEDQPQGVSWDANAQRPTVADGVIRMAYPDLSGQSGSGLYFVDFAESHGFEIGPGESLFVQFRARMSQALSETEFFHSDGSRTKPKMLIISDSGEDSGNSSCTANHFVLTTNNMGPNPGDPRSLFPYNRCRPTQTITHIGPKPGGSRLWDTQPITTTLGRSEDNPGLPVGESVDRRCWSGDDPTQEGDGYEACWTLPTDRWATYQVGLTFDSESYIESQSGREVWNTRVQVWAQADGEARELVVDTVHPYSRADMGLGRVWLLIFMTKKDPTIPHAGDVYADYDELILSRSRIPDPKVLP